ncbi:MarR family winged helix-turn-helix transcriptional regulator [Tamaricihabitans halophyticus]|uniref:MarR family winged helix-turn-helix transcriptional regulator n=1 Tax=Tamaricihabitans halophyticus TaxID=1262583 RepID=UPI001FB4B97D|nr:MarR family transcriptional regulator [Tamaricihabitans halophyticus]
MVEQDEPQPEAEADHAAREEAATAIERELSVLFARARSFSLSIAAEVHPELDSAAYALLVRLSDIEPVRAAEVVDKSGLDKSTVSRQIARLEELSLIERVIDPTDGRARLVQLTEAGRERLTAVRARRSQRLRDTFTSWSTADASEFGRLLGKFNTGLEPRSR